MAETSPASAPQKKLSSMVPERTRVEVANVDAVINGALSDRNLKPAGEAPAVVKTLSRKDKEKRRETAQDEAKRADAVVRGQLAYRGLTSVVPAPAPEQKKDPSAQLWNSAVEKVQARITVDEELEKRKLKPMDEVNAERNGASR